MLKWALLFLLLAIIFSLFGFEVIASTFAGIAQILFIVFLVLFVILLVLGRRLPRRSDHVTQP